VLSCSRNINLKQEDIIYELETEASVSHEQICIKISHAVSYSRALNLQVMMEA
jgi:hypothetical protein